MIFKEENTPDAYLVNAQMKKKGEIILTWTAIGDRKVQPIEDGTTFVVESPKLKYLLKFDRNAMICYIIEYNQKEDLNGYCYYTKHKSDKLKECGLVKNDEYIPFKEFDNGIMKEYTYSFDNDHIVVDSNEMVYEGKYQDNPSEHYPRVVPNALEKLPELPKNVKEAIINSIKEIEQGQYEVVVKTGTDLSQIDGNVEILRFEESYMNEKQDDFVINEKQFPHLRKLILESNCQNSKRKTFGLFEVSGCPNLEEIEVKSNSFCWYKKYVIKGIAILSFFHIDLPCLKSIKLNSGFFGVTHESTYEQPGQSSLEMISTKWVHYKL